jgi:hypothetical protein
MYKIALALAMASFGLLCSTSSLQAQDQPFQQAVCGTDESYARAVQANPELLTIQKQMDEQFSGPSAMMTATDTQTVVIPVVFHIITTYGPENITKQAMEDAIFTLNQSYRKWNLDTLGVRAVFKKLISDAHIEFRLATKDPMGNCSEGFDRVYSELTDQAGDNVKYLSQWDNKRYLNVWVVRSINSTGVNGTITGYSQFPWQAVTNAATDGIIMDYHYIKKFDKTLSHEVGHYLGLYHTFQDGCSANQSLQGDLLSDTPPAAAANFGWNTSSNTCHNDVPDLPDMIENFMDYSDHHFLFTPQQVKRMRSFLFSNRASLLTPENQLSTLGYCSDNAAAGIKEISSFSAVVNIYPNPASSSFNIGINASSSATAKLNIVDMTGKIVFSQTGLRINSGHQELSYNAESLKLASGIYMIQLQAAGQNIEKKIVLQ